MPSLTISPVESAAILVAYDELLSYYDTVGEEGFLDHEEMCDWTGASVLRTLHTLLCRLGEVPSLPPRGDGSLHA